MSEPKGERTVIRRFSFLGTQCRALIGADGYAWGLASPVTWVAHQ